MLRTGNVRVTQILVNLAFLTTWEVEVWQNDALQTWTPTRQKFEVKEISNLN